jgi:hypothetical protein
VRCAPFALPVYLEVEGAGIAVRTFHRAADGTLVTTRNIGSAYEVEQHDAAEGGLLVQFASDGNLITAGRRLSAH